MLAIITVATMALMGFAHYAAPRLFRKNPLPRLLTYSIGVALGILAPFAALTWVAGWEWEYFVALLMICAGAGAGTFLAWGLDEWGS